MFRVEDVLLLKEGEHVKTLARRHIATLLPRLFFALMLLVIPFFLLFPLFNWGVLGIIIFIALFGCGATLAIRSMLLWDADVLIVTNTRVVDVDQRGLFTRMVSEAPLGSIQDVSWAMRGPLESMFRMGTLRIRLASGTTTIEAKRISHPKELHQMISEMRHPGESNVERPNVERPNVERSEAPGELPLPPVEKRGNLEMSDRLRRIVTMLGAYSEEDLSRIESVLKARETKT